jgi:hypothetical protein
MFAEQLPDTEILLGAKPARAADESSIWLPSQDPYGRVMPGAHGGTLVGFARSSWRAASASSSGAADRYQLFRDRNNWYYSDSRVIPMPVPLPV